MKKIRICVALKNGTVMRGQSVKKDCQPLLEQHLFNLWSAIVEDKQSVPEGSTKIVRFKEFLFNLRDFAGAWVEEV